MSEASEAAIARALSDVKALEKRAATIDRGVRAEGAAITSAQELRLIRGELEAIRILLSEGQGVTTASAGGDMGNS